MPGTLSGARRGRRSDTVGAMASGGDLYEQLVDAANAIYGSHPHRRALHAKGTWCEGSFTATPEAAQLCRAAHFQGDPVPALIRFSNGSGDPESHDAGREARGMAVKLRPENGDETDILADHQPRLRHPDPGGVPRAAAPPPARPRDRASPTWRSSAPSSPPTPSLSRRSRRRSAPSLPRASPSSPTARRTRSSSSTPPARGPGSATAGARRRARPTSPTTRPASAAATTCARSSPSGFAAARPAFELLLQIRRRGRPDRRPHRHLAGRPRAGRRRPARDHRDRRRPRVRRPHRGLRPDPDRRRHRALRRPDPARPRPGPTRSRPTGGWGSRSRTRRPLRRPPSSRRAERQPRARPVRAGIITRPRAVSSVGRAPRFTRRRSLVRARHRPSGNVRSEYRGGIQARAQEAGNRGDVETLLEVLDPRGGVAHMYEAFDEIQIEVSEIRDLGDRLVAIGRTSARGRESGATESPHRLGGRAQERQGDFASGLSRAHAILVYSLSSNLLDHSFTFVLISYPKPSKPPGCEE